MKDFRLDSTRDEATRGNGLAELGGEAVQTRVIHEEKLGGQRFRVIVVEPELVVKVESLDGRDALGNELWINRSIQRELANGAIIAALLKYERATFPTPATPPVSTKENNQEKEK